MNCHPVAGVLPPQLGLEAVLAVQNGGLVIAAIDVDLKKNARVLNLVPNT